jgi:hypothetical protein
MKTTILSLILIACTAVLPGVTFGESAPEKTQIWERQRPTITVQEAIRRAEQYIVENHIDVSAHFISSVRYMETGSLTNSFIGKGPYWHVTYELVKPSDGGQYFILVYMDGKIGLIGGR